MRGPRALDALAVSVQTRHIAIDVHLDGGEIMDHLGITPGPVVGEALAHLLEIRLDEGPLDHDEALRRLDAWWATRDLPS